MKKIDMRSLLIGILTTALIMVSVGAVGKPSSEIGRYSYKMIQGGQGAMTMLDTSTGQTWTWTEVQAKKRSPFWVKVVRFAD